MVDPDQVVRFSKQKKKTRTTIQAIMMAVCVLAISQEVKYRRLSISKLTEAINNYSKNTNSKPKITKAQDY